MNPVTHRQVSPLTVRWSGFRRGLATISSTALGLFLAPALVAQEMPARRPRPNSADSPRAQPEPEDSREGILELSDALSLEHRRYLVYLYARLGKPGIASELARRILEEIPNDKQTLLVLAGMHIEQKNVDRALYYGETLVKQFANDEQSLYYLGAAYYLAERFAEARDVLRQIKSERYPRSTYPYQSDLASATFRASDWYRAMLAYQELLRRHDLTDEVRLGVRQILEGIHRLHLPQLSVDSTAYLLSPGSSYETHIDYRQHVTDRHKIFLRWDREDTLVKERPLLRRRSTDRNDVSIGIESILNNTWTTSVSAGGSESGVVGNATIAGTFGEQRTLKLELMGNQPSRDGLLFQSLDGRRNRLILSGNYRIGRNWLLAGETYGWESTIDRNRLGLGYGGMWSVERVLIRNQPDWRIGYRGIWTRFSPTSGDARVVLPSASSDTTALDHQTLLENLLLPAFHRQGLYFTWVGRLSRTLSYHTGAGVDYDFDQMSIEQHAAAGFTFYPMPRAELKSELAFASSARTADQGSELWQINLAFKFWF